MRSEGRLPTRASFGGMIYHALNCGDCHAPVYNKPAGYDAFVAALAGRGPAPPPLDIPGVSSTSAS